MKEEKVKFGKSYFDMALLAEAAVAIIGLIVLIISSQYRKIGLIILIAMAVVMVLQVIVISSYKITVSDHRLQIARGVISKSCEEVDLSNIASVKVKQSLMGRMFDFGDVTLDIIGKSPLLLPQIRDCNRLKDVLEGKMA